MPRADRSSRTRRWTTSVVTIRAGADLELAERYAHVPEQVAVWRDDLSAEHPLRLRFADLDREAQAAILGLDPIRDREEYAVLTELLCLQEGGKPLVTRVEQLLEASTPGARELGLRAQNLGVLEWSVWSSELPSLVEELRDPSARCTVVDLGSLGTPQEQHLVAEAVLASLWDSRLSRRPCLIVIDEAHNICAAYHPTRSADSARRRPSRSLLRDGSTASTC